MENTDSATEAEPSYFTQKPVRPPSYPTSVEHDGNNDEVELAPAPNTVPARKGLRKWLKKIPRGRKDSEPSIPKNMTDTVREMEVDSTSQPSSTGSQIGFNRPGMKVGYLSSARITS